MTEAMLDGKSVAPSSEELIGRAQSLIPLLRANAGLADRLGHLPDVSVAGHQASPSGNERPLRPRRAQSSSGA